VGHTCTRLLSRATLDHPHVREPSRPQTRSSGEAPDRATNDDDAGPGNGRRRARHRQSGQAGDDLRHFTTGTPRKPLGV